MHYLEDQIVERSRGQHKDGMHTSKLRDSQIVEEVRDGER